MRAGIRQLAGAFFALEAMVPSYAHAQKLYWATFDRTSIWRGNIDGSHVERVYKQDFFAPVKITIHKGQGKIYWTDPQAIYRANKDGSSVELVVSSAGPRDLVIDEAGGKIYWTSVPFNNQQSRILRANLDGSNVETVLLGGTNSQLDSLAFDPVDQKLYWPGTIGSGLVQIYRSNLDGSNPEVVIPFRNQHVRGMAVDPVGRRLYWADWNSMIIESSDLDGSNENTIAYTGPERPMGIAVAPQLGRVYWSRSVNLETNPFVSRIESAAFDGQDRTTIMDNYWVQGLVVDEDAGELYWVDQALSAVQKSSLSSLQIQDVVTNDFVFVEAMAFDLKHNGLVWSDGYNLPWIRRGNANGSGVTPLLFNDSDFARGLAIDDNTNQILWTYPDDGTIRRAEADGSGIHTIVDPVDYAIELAWDELTHTAYWVEYCLECKEFEARIKGKTVGVGDIFTVVDLWPSEFLGLAVDPATKMLFFGDEIGRVMRVDLQAMGEPQLVFDTNVPLGVTGLALDRKSKKVYWSMKAGGGIYRANEDGTQVEPVIESLEPPAWLRGIDPRVPGDVDHSGRVDLADFAMFQRCPHGQWDGSLEPGCTFFDSDPADHDVDLADFQRWVIEMTGK